MYQYNAVTDIEPTLTQCILMDSFKSLQMSGALAGTAVSISPVHVNYLRFGRAYAPSMCQRHSATYIKPILTPAHVNFDILVDIVTDQWCVGSCDRHRSSQLQSISPMHVNYRSCSRVGRAYAPATCECNFVDDIRPILTPVHVNFDITLQILIDQWRVGSIKRYMSPMHVEC
jgi:hypothetical protein